MAVVRTVHRLACLSVLGGLLLTATPAHADEATQDPGPAATQATTSSITPSSAPSSDPSSDPAPEPEPTTAATSVTLTGADSAYVAATVVLTVALHDETGSPVAAAEVRLQRRVDGVWRDVASLTTDGAGVAEAQVKVSWVGADDAFQAVFAGADGYDPSTSAVHQVRPRKYATRLTVAGPDQVVDERWARLAVTWTAANGRPVNRAVRLFVKLHGEWRAGPLVRLGRDGFARVAVRPRDDSRWKAVGVAGTWHRGDVSNVHVLDNVPPGVVVRLPKGTPRPTVVVPPQRRALGAGPNVRVSRIPDAVWGDMVGVSWTPRCPVGRSSLRLVRVNYWGYDGYRHRGELVVYAGVASRVGGAFADLYRHRVPIRSMYRVDVFGYNRTLRGGDDYESMSAGNTSAFNCRGVANKPSVLSPHAMGRALDINPWENPYASRYPNTYWRYHRLNAVVTWRSASDLVPRLLRRHGLRWTYGLTDIHHFDA